MESLPLSLLERLVIGYAGGVTLNAIIALLFAFWLLGLISGLMGPYIHIFLVLALVAALLKVAQDRKEEESAPERSYVEGQRTFHLHSRASRESKR